MEVVVTLFKVFSGICLEVLGKTKRNLHKDSRSPGRDFNLGSPEYIAGGLTTLLRSWAWISCFHSNEIKCLA